MKKITAIIVLFMTLFFIITPANAKSEVTIHLVEDKLARTFDNFYNGDKKQYMLLHMIQIIPLFLLK